MTTQEKIKSVVKTNGTGAITGATLQEVLLQMQGDVETLQDDVDHIPTIDDTPTADSTNPVSSSGVNSAIENAKEYAEKEADAALAEAKEYTDTAKSELQSSIDTVEEKADSNTSALTTESATRSEADEEIGKAGGAALALLGARVDALEGSRDKLGAATARSIDANEVTRYRYPLVMLGHGVPSASVTPTNLPDGLPWDGVPVFAGQLYINLDATSGGLYYAAGMETVSDWKNA